MGKWTLLHFETEKIAGKFTLNLLQIKEPQHCYRKYWSQRPRIDTNIDGQLTNVKLSLCFWGCTYCDLHLVAHIFMLIQPQTCRNLLRGVGEGYAGLMSSSNTTHTSGGHREKPRATNKIHMPFM